ncbi:MAG: hypothetical protein H8E55_45570 [Pelagibacterales bacterium]|nr:hypothetical protein [Pelagibacterales bacterium]
MKFIELFEGSDMFYLADPSKLTFKKNGGSRWGVTKEFNIPLAEAIEGHLTGTSKKGVVLPPIRKSDNKCLFGAIDVDGNIYKDDNFKREILDKIKKLALPLVACFSKSKGLHLYIKFQHWTDAQKVIDILHTFLHKLGLPEKTECFPKQAIVKDTGNGIMLPHMKDIGNDWIKTYDDMGFTTGTEDEFKECLSSTRVNAEDIQIELPEAVKANGKANGADFLNSQSTGPNKFTILKKIKDGTIEAHPTMGGKYHNWIQVVIGKCVKEGYGDNEILKLIKEVHQDKRGLEYKWPESYQKQIDYTRGSSRFNKPNPGETDILEGRSVLEGFLDEELERKQQEFFDDTIYAKLDDRWHSKKTGGEYKGATIKVANGHIFKGDVIKEFSKDEERKQEVEMGVYRPDLWVSNDDPIVEDEDGLKQLNIYRPGGPEALPADTPQRKKELQMFLDLVKKLTEHEKIGWNAENEEVSLYDYVLDHLTMPFKRPGEKVRSCIVMHSVDNQVGKSTLFETVERGLGSKNCIVITPENACRREKAFLQNQLVLIDELLIDGDWKKKISVLNVLKPLMTGEKHDCRPLFKESRQVYSTCNFMTFTNHKHAIAIKELDARYTCIDVNKNREEMGGDKFFRPYWEAIKKGTLVNVVKHFLMKRDLTKNFDPAGISLRTNFIKTMEEYGGHPLFVDVKALLNEGQKPFNQSVISIHDAWEYLKKEARLKGSINEFAEILLKLKCERIGECKHRKSRKKVTGYIIKNFKFFDGMSDTEVISNYWLPTEIELESNGSETYNLSKSELGEIRSHLYEVEAYEDMMEDEVKPKVLRFEDGDYSNAINASDPSVKEKIKEKTKRKKIAELEAKEDYRKKHSPPSSVDEIVEDYRGGKDH